MDELTVVGGRMDGWTGFISSNRKKICISKLVKRILNVIH